MLDNNFCVHIYIYMIVGSERGGEKVVILYFGQKILSRRLSL